MSRIAFVTGHSFGCRALEGILSSRELLSGAIELPLVIGLSGEKESQTCGYESPHPQAEAAGAVYLEVHDGTLRGVKGKIRALEIDYLLVIGWSRLIPRDVLELPKGRIHGHYGAIGMHPTLLPVGRGRAPIPWTIIQDLEKTGLSVFSLFETADSGMIIEQFEIPLSGYETSTSLFYRFNSLHYTAGRSLAAKLACANWDSAYYQDEAQATYWMKRRPEDSKIDLDFTVSDAINRVRAQKWPYPQTTIRLETIDYAVEEIHYVQQNAQSFRSRKPGQNRIVRFADASAMVKLSAI